MPLPSDRPDAAATATSLSRAIVRIGSRVLVLLVVGFCILLLGIRFIVFPQMQNRQEQIAQVLSQQIGQPVEIGALATGWDGWNPRLDVTDFRIGDPAAGGAVGEIAAGRAVVVRE